MSKDDNAGDKDAVGMRPAAGPFGLTDRMLLRPIRAISTSRNQGG